MNILIFTLIGILLLYDFKYIRFFYADVRPFLIKFIKEALKYMKDWRTFLSFFIAWMITNGWCYLFIIFGKIFEISWMRITGWSYLAFLWLPCTPEKVVTIPLSVFFYKLLSKNKSRANIMLNGHSTKKHAPVTRMKNNSKCERKKLHNLNF